MIAVYHFSVMEMTVPTDIQECNGLAKDYKIAIELKQPNVLSFNKNDCGQFLKKVYYQS